MSRHSQHDEAVESDPLDPKRTVIRPLENVTADEERKDIFEAVLKQIKFDGIAFLATSVRQENESKHSASTSRVGCKVLRKPCRGSYNLVYRMKFDDGVQWALKVPRDGFEGCWGALASEALTSEALTMGMIRKEKPAIPLPTVHSFDASMNNEILCPYILMDWLHGKPLWEAWHQNDISYSRQQQIRIRALETLAAAMVELSEIRFEKAGGLQFDADGNFVDIGKHKTPDWHLEADRPAKKRDTDDDLFYTKESTGDPKSWVLHMLNRRGTKYDDMVLEMGRHETLRMFTQWAFEVLEAKKPEGKEFVLAHPDLDSQNLLVKPDGTLCGIIDWDRVCSVPHAVGALKYPLWLMRDWQPTDYNYNIEAQCCNEEGRLDDSPDELAHYRCLYAQAIESIVRNSTKDTVRSKQASNITRLSLILGNLEYAADNPWFTVDIMTNIFEQLDAAREELGYDTDSEDDDSEHEDEDVGGVKIDPTIHDQRYLDDGTVGETPFPKTFVNVKKTKFKEPPLLKLDRVSTLSPKNQPIKDLPSTKDQAPDTVMLGHSDTSPDGDGDRNPTLSARPYRSLGEELCKTGGRICKVLAGRLHRNDNMMRRIIRSICYKGTRKSEIMENLEAQTTYSTFIGETESMDEQQPQVISTQGKLGIDLLAPVPAAPTVEQPACLPRAREVAKAGAQDDIRGEPAQTPYAEAFNRMGRMLKDSGVSATVIQREQAKFFELIVNLRDEKQPMLNKQEEEIKKTEEKGKGPDKRIRGVKNTHAAVEEGPAHAADPEGLDNVGEPQDEEANVLESDVMTGARPSFRNLFDKMLATERSAAPSTSEQLGRPNRNRSAGNNLAEQGLSNTNSPQSPPAAPTTLPPLNRLDPAIIALGRCDTSCPCGSQKEYRKCCSLSRTDRTPVETSKDPSPEGITGTDPSSSLAASPSDSPRRNPSSGTCLTFSTGDGECAFSIDKKNKEKNVVRGVLRVSEIERAAQRKRIANAQSDREECSVLKNEGVDPEVKDEAEEVDNGGMTMNEIYVAVAKGELGEERTRELRKRFRLLMRVVLGEE